jgi:hypothetical protein
VSNENSIITKRKRKRARFAPIAIIGAVAAATLLSLSLTGTMSGFIASIQNNTNTAGSGSLVMQERTTGSTPITCLSTDGGTLATNTATCSTINKFGGNLTMVPGQSVVQNITITDIGTANVGTFTLTHGASCTQAVNGAFNGGASDVCSKMTVSIVSGSTTVYSGTVAGLAAALPAAIAMPAAPAAGVAVPFVITTTLPLTVDNTYQGYSVSLPLTWTFTA